MNEDRAQELRQILAASGSVTFIKSGQALSLRGDLVKNREYVRELTKLQASSERRGRGVVCATGVLSVLRGIVCASGGMRRACHWVFIDCNT